MQIKFHQQSPLTKLTKTLKAVLDKHLTSGRYNRSRVAVAYATVSGLRDLVDAFPRNSLTQSEWLIGLDDLITQPGVFDALEKLDHATVKFATYRSRGRRFHPKVFSFSNTSDPQRDIAIIGSANLSSAAFAGNAEAAAIVDLSSASARASFETFWKTLWQQGRRLTKAQLESYRKRYESRPKGQPPPPLPPKASTKKPKKRKQILSSDDVEIDPTVARVCWIEGGNITALGRELEFKAEQALFFGLPRSGGKSKTFNFVTSAGKVVPLLMKYQGNHMWRLQLNREVPEVERGLRPKLPTGKLGRSPFVAVFARKHEVNHYSLRFVRLKGSEFRKLVARSKRSGSYGRTTARQYGWY
ncbi:MAG: phospholipase D family protein [Reyranella sp.]